ncbi:MAG: hypothetical protein IJT58_04600 [Synergistaceae bacterium]|nr:hypothetical protein [Synergistaceae bacterium]
MKRFKAFTLTEILTGTMLQAGFVLVLMGAFYMLVNFQAASTKLITAREKGQRVLAYIENRVIHAGLGLHKCSSSKEIRESFAEGLRGTNKAFNNITLPVAVTNSSSSWNTTATEPNTDTASVYRGNILTVLYARPDTDTSRALIIENALKARDNDGAVKTISGDVSCRFITDSAYKIDTNTDGGDKLKYYASGDDDNLYSYKVTASSGAPLYISEFTNGKNFKLTTKFTVDSIDIASGSELLYLECEKMYVSGTTFECVRLENKNSWSKESGTNYGYEDGILAVYFELNTSKNTLDCYVLASGGQDPSLDNPIPKSWPDNTVTKSLRENWSKSGYGYNHHEVYVSRASYKLHNVGWSSSSGWTKN